MTTIVLPKTLPIGTRSAQDRRFLLVGLVGCDVVALAVSGVLAFNLRSNLDDVLPLAQLMVYQQALTAMLFGLISICLLRLHGLYDTSSLLAGTREYGQVAHALTYSAMGILGLSFFAGREWLVSRSWLLLVWLLSITAVMAVRFALRRAVRALRLRGRFRTRIMIVGASTMGVSLAAQLHGARNEGLDVVGFLDEYLPLGLLVAEGITVRGRPADLLRTTYIPQVDEIVLVPSALPHERLQALARWAVTRRSPIVRIAVGTTDLLTQGMLVTHRGSVPLMTVRQAGITGLEAILKRLLDIGGGLAALGIFAVPTGFVLLRALIQGTRPLFERQMIRGVGGASVSIVLCRRAVTACLPLRGMPALFSVLSGKLSLVGPRPGVNCNGEPAVPQLTTVPPGLTGPWRLPGPSTGLDGQGLADLTYLRNYTVWEDLRIIMQSFRGMFAQLSSHDLIRWQAAVPRDQPEARD